VEAILGYVIILNLWPHELPHCLHNPLALVILIHEPLLSQNLLVEEAVLLGKLLERVCNIVVTITN
jgi:hypothetical protein